MSFPDPTVLENIISNYLTRLEKTKDSTATAVKKVVTTFKNSLAATVTSLFPSPQTENFFAQTSLDENARGRTCSELINHFKAAKTVEDWIKIIDLLGKTARIAQEGGYTFSRLCEALHAARTYIIYSFNQENGDATRAFHTEFKRRSSAFTAAKKQENDAELAGYILPEFDKDILIRSADLGHEKSILDAAKRGLFNSLEVPDKNLAPRTPYLKKISTPVEPNVHYPWVYQKNYFVRYCKEHGVSFATLPALQSSSVRQLSFSTYPPSSTTSLVNSSLTSISSSLSSSSSSSSSSSAYPAGVSSSLSSSSASSASTFSSSSASLPSSSLASSSLSCCLSSPSLPSSPSASSLTLVEVDLSPPSTPPVENTTIPAATNGTSLSCRQSKKR